jgi:hypothetical protein
LGQGDFVFIAAKGTHEGEPSGYVDLYRVEDEKIVEHWGFPQKIPPQSELKHHNGMHRGSSRNREDLYRNGGMNALPMAIRKR